MEIIAVCIKVAIIREAMPVQYCGMALKREPEALQKWRVSVSVPFFQLFNTFHLHHLLFYRFLPLHSG
jgi:hypothetical protein